MSKIKEEVINQINEFTNNPTARENIKKLIMGKTKVVLENILKDIREAGALGKDDLSKKALYVKETERQIKKYDTIHSNSKKSKNRNELVEKAIDGLISTINSVYTDIQMGNRPQLPTKPYLSDVEQNKLLTEEEEEEPEKEVEVEVGTGPDRTSFEPLDPFPQGTLEDLPKSEDDAIIEITNKRPGWENYLRSKDVSINNKKSFVSRIMTDNRKNNIIFTNPVPKDNYFSGNNLNTLISNIKKISKNKNFYGKNIERAQIKLENINTVNGMKRALKSKVYVTNLLNKKQGNTFNINKNTLARIKSDIENLYAEKSVEQILEDSDDDDEEPRQPAGRPPDFTRLVPDEASVRIPKNIPLGEFATKELKIFENQLMYNMFRSQAYDNLKNKLEYKRASPNAKNQLMINEVTKLRRVNAAAYKKEVTELYKYVGKSLGINNPTKKNVVKLLTEQVGGTLKDSLDNAERIKKRGIRLEELRNLNRQLNKDEEAEFDELMKNLGTEEEDQEVDEELTVLLKKGLSLANQYTKKSVTHIATPSQRITAARDKEIEEAQQKGSLGVLPEEISAKPVAIPDVNKELLKTRQNIARLQQAKEEGKDIDESVLQDLEREKLEQENILRGKRKDKVVPVSKPSDAIGVYRPYFPNVTEGNVDAADIINTIDEQMAALRNAEIFDIPSDQNGGIGTVRNNPLLRQNKETFNRTHEGTLNDIVTWDNYAQSESFWNPAPTINQKKAMEQINYDKFINNENLVSDFLEIFNQNNNGFIDQYQSAKDTNTSALNRDVFIPPSNFYRPTKYNNFANVLNQGFLETDFLNNINYFVDIVNNTE